MSAFCWPSFAGLIVLTAITVAVSYFDLGPFNLIVAMSIATIKAALVAMWFMHLRYDSGLHALIFLVGVVVSRTVSGDRHARLRRVSPQHAALAAELAVAPLSGLVS